MFPDLFSERFWRSSTLIEAAHVSAILYFAVVSWVSKYFEENGVQWQFNGVLDQGYLPPLVLRKSCTIIIKASNDFISTRTDNEKYS